MGKLLTSILSTLLFTSGIMATDVTGIGFEPGTGSATTGYALDWTTNTLSNSGSVVSGTIGKSLGACSGATWDVGDASSAYMIDSNGKVWKVAHGLGQWTALYVGDSGMAGTNKTIYGMASQGGNYYAIVYDSVAAWTYLYKWENGLNNTATSIGTCTDAGGATPLMRTIGGCSSGLVGVDNSGKWYTFDTDAMGNFNGNMTEGGTGNTSLSVDSDSTGQLYGSSGTSWFKEGYTNGNESSSQSLSSTVQYITIKH